MLFSGGAATEGPGLVVGPELKEPIRSHHDIDRDSVKHFKRATKVCSHFDSISAILISEQFYEGLAKRASNNGHTVDLFAGCLDQVGLLEMKSLPNSTNGVMVLSDSFATSIFKQSFLRVFVKDDQGNLQMGFNATFDVQVSIARIFYLFCTHRLHTFTDYERTEGLWSDWTCYLRGEEVGMCWRDRDRHWPDIGLEN